MTQVSTAPRPDTQDTQETVHKLPPIDCAPWCEDGNGHTDAEHPDDQSCVAGYVEFPFARGPQEVVKGSGMFYPRSMTLSLQRDTFADPFVTLWQSGLVELTATEARQVAEHLLHLADMVEATR